MTTRYEGTRCALLTQHGKERVMTPLFAQALGVRLELATGFDTDTLGTFTRELARDGTQLEAARKKAEVGMALLQLDQGVASEGAFGPDPLGLFPWNVELVVFIDRARGVEVVGSAQGPARHHHQQVSTSGELEAFAHKAGFPEHGLVVRPDDEHDLRVHKGLASWPTLHAAFLEAMAEARTSTVFVESDLRALHNPTRMALIREATQNLVERLASECPHCGLPGFWRVERLPGLPCRECRAPTNQVRAERWECVVAGHGEVREVSGGWADPQWCNACNP